MLRPTGLDTLATELWTATAAARYAEAAPYAVLLVLLAAIPTWLLATRSGVVAAGGEGPTLLPEVGAVPAPERVTVGDVGVGGQR
jgi:iron(III) transport system permease protein